MDWYENLLKQQQIKATGGRVVDNFQFEHKRNREGFAKMVIESRLPFGFGEVNLIIRTCKDIINLHLKGFLNQY
jgi:hypothetical protein